MIPFLHGVWNNRFQKATHTYALDTHMFPAVVGPTGHQFFISENLFTVPQAFDDYNFEGFRDTDTVLDLGANVGGFAIPAAEHVETVIALEPITFLELKNNISLNKLQHKIQIKAFALKSPEPVKWRGRVVDVYKYKLLDLKYMFHPDIIKCDVEGAERYIVPQFLDGIRIIQMEMHAPYNQELIQYIKEHWTTEIKREGKHTLILHARDFHP